MKMEDTENGRGQMIQKLSVKNWVCIIIKLYGGICSKDKTHLLHTTLYIFILVISSHYVTKSKANTFTEDYM